MVLYGLIAYVTTIISYFYGHTKGNVKKMMWILLILFPVTFSALRGVSTDYVQHRIAYESIISGEYIYADYGSIAVIVMRLLGKIKMPYQMTIALISFFTIYIAFYIFKIYEDSISVWFAVLSFMLQYYLLSFNLYRQFLSIELLMLAVVYKAKFSDEKRFWIFGVLGGLVHSSAFLLLPVVFFWKYITEKKYSFFRFAVYIVSVITITLIPGMAEQLTSLGSLFLHYRNYFMHFHPFRLGYGSIRYLVLAIIPALAMACILKKKQTDELKFCPFFAAFGTILWLVSYISDTFMYRISFFLLAVLPLIHGFIFNQHVSKKFGRLYVEKKRIGIIVAVSAFMMVFWYYDFKILVTGEVCPYMFFWQ